MKTTVNFKVNGKDYAIMVDGHKPNANITKCMEYVLDEYIKLDNNITLCKSVVNDINKALKNNIIMDIIYLANEENNNIFNVLANKHTFGGYSIKFEENIYTLSNVTTVEKPVEKVKENGIEKITVRPIFITYDDIIKFVANNNSKCKKDDTIEKFTLTNEIISNDFMRKIRFFSKCIDDTLTDNDKEYFTKAMETDTDYKAFAKYFDDRNSKTAKAEIMQVFYNYFSTKTNLDAKALPFIWELVKLSVLSYKNVIKKLDNKKENAYINALFIEFINSNEKLILKHNAKNPIESTKKKTVKKEENITK